MLFSRWLPACLAMLAAAGSAPAVQNSPPTSPQATNVSPAQTNSAAEERRHAADLISEGGKLLNQRTPESFGQAISTFEQALALWRKVADEPKQVEALLAISTGYFLLHNTTDVVRTLTQAQNLAHASGDRAGEATVLASFAFFDDSLGDDTKALKEASETAQLWDALGRKNDEALAWTFEAGIYQKLKDLPRCIDSFERALTLFRATGNAQQTALALLNVGQIYNLVPEQQAREKAVARFTEALPAFQAAKDRFNEGMAWWGLATSNDFLHRADEARTAYSKALPIMTELKNSLARGQILLSLGEDEEALKNLQNAEGDYEQAIPLLTGPTQTLHRYLADMHLGSTRESLGKNGPALQAYQQALAESRSAADLPAEASAHLRIGAMYLSELEWQPALEADREAFNASQRAGDARTQASALIGMSGAYESLGEYKKSLECARQALPLLKGDDIRSDRATMLLTIGDCYNALHESKKALDYLGQALALEDENPAGKAAVLASLGEVYGEMGDHKTALQKENEALEICRSLHEAAAEAKVLNDIGITYEWLGDKTKAESIFQEALASARARNDIQQQAAPLNNLGELARFFGDNREAQKLYEQSLALNRQIGDTYQEAAILANLGQVYHALGEEQKAFDEINQALEIRRKLGDRNGEAKTLGDLAGLYGDTGEFQKALQANTQALALLENSDDPETEASLLNDLGSVYRSLGANDLAERYFLKALEAREKLQDEFDEAVVLNNLGVLAQTMNDTTKALDYYGKSLTVAEKLGNKLGQARLLANEAALYGDRGDQQHALKNLERSLQIAREIGDLGTQAQAIHAQGTVHDKLGDPQQALHEYQQALALWRQLNSVEGEEQTLYVKAKTERTEGDLSSALRDVQQAIRLSESLRGRVASEDLRASFLATVGNYYELEIDVLMQLHHQHPEHGYDAQALQASERARARSLLDLLVESHADIRQGVDPQLLTRERAIERSLNAKAAERRKLSESPEGQADAEKLEREIEDLTAAYETVQAQIRSTSPAYAALTQPQPLGLRQIQEQVLDPGTLLLEYSLGQDRSYLWAVTSASLKSYELPKRSDIEAQASEYNDLLVTNAENPEALAQAASALSATLLGPVASELKTNRLIIVADGLLQQRVPFSILPEPPWPAAQHTDSATAQPLLLHHEVFSEPSASALAILRQQLALRKPPPKSVAVIADPVFGPPDDRLPHVTGNSAPSTAAARAPAASRDVLETAARQAGVADGIPRLPHTGEEARQILALIPPEQSLSLLGFSAQKSAAENPELSRYRIVHFATHGLLDPAHPELSGLVLSLYDHTGQPIDGFLRLNEIFNLKLPVQLVVLSACESGQGKLVRGEGLVGLTRGFMYAGAASLVVSLWSLNDASTAELMTRFYKGMLGTEHLRPAAALRAAQLSMRNDPKWKNPYYWAAFTLQGEWR